MYGGCHWLRWATACISWSWCQKRPSFATGSWFTPYKVLLGCVLQLTMILNEKIKAKPSLNTFTLSEMFSKSCLSSLEFLWANWGLYLGWRILSITVLYGLGRGQRQWKLRDQESGNKGQRLAYSLSLSRPLTPTTTSFPWRWHMIPALNLALRAAQGASSVMVVYLVTMRISCHKKRTLSLKQVPYGKKHVPLLPFVPLAPITCQGHSMGLRKACWVSLARTLLKDSESATRPYPGILVTWLWGKFAFWLWSPWSFIKETDPTWSQVSPGGSPLWAQMPVRAHLCTYRGPGPKSHTAVMWCSHKMAPEDLRRGGGKTNQPTPGAVLESSCFPGISLGLLGFPRAADSADKRSQWHWHVYVYHM